MENLKKFYLIAFLALFFLGLGSLTAKAQAQTATGIVISDMDQTAIPGANVLIKGTANGTTTDFDGNFSLKVDKGQTLVVSFIGMKPKEVVFNGEAKLKIVLEQETNQLADVVVVGYGTMKKSDITGSVSSVKKEDLQQVATVDVAQALQGRASGVQVIANSGEPGAGMKVRVRGMGTMNNSDPLYVVDGFPTGDISYLSPKDIESMEVLKDASATAIYGNRGANGVVMITTTKGKAGKTSFSFDMYTGTQQAWKKLDLLNAAQYSTLALEAYSNDDPSFTINPLSTVQNRLVYARDNNLVGTDWQDEIFQVAPMQNYSFSVSGGTEASKFSVSATYFDQEGIVKNSGMKKFFFRTNGDFKLTEKITAGVGVSYINVDKSNYAASQYAGVLPVALGSSPVVQSYNPETGKYGNVMEFSEGYNPVRILDQSRFQKYFQDKFVANAYVSYKILPNLTFTSNFGGNLSFQRTRNYNPAFAVSSTEFRDLSELYLEKARAYDWNSSNVLQYDMKFADHSITLTAGTEASTGNYYQGKLKVFDVSPDETQWYESAAKGTKPAEASSSQSETALLSVFGRAAWSFQDGRFSLTATGRRDGSSRFITNRYGFFPSFAGAWNIKQESFLKDNPLIDKLKLRVGWGIVGNQNSAGAYDFVTLVTGDQRAALGGKGVEGRIPTTLSNANLSWETSKSTSAGIDAAFFNNAWEFSLDLFVKDTYDMIIQTPVPGYVGAYAPRVNAGKMKNAGIEFSTSYKSSIGELNYEVNGNISSIKNELVSFGETAEDANISKLGNTKRLEEGEEFAYFYGFKTDGIFNSQEELDAYVFNGASIQPNAKPGDVKFVDTNNDGKIDGTDRLKLGSPFPDFYYGFGAKFDYKGFDFNVYLQGSEGNSIANTRTFDNANVQGKTNSYASRWNRWTAATPNNNEPRMTNANANNNMRFSDRYVEDGSYLRLKTVQLGYTLPTSISSYIGLQNIRIYLAGDNLLTFTKYTGYEPEVGDRASGQWEGSQYSGIDLATYPQARTLRGGIQIKF